MVSLNIYKLDRSKGFTLIEIVIVIGILIMIISFGLVVDFNITRSGNFLTEQYKLISILERARSHAMANLVESDHGVCYIAPNLVVFRKNDGNCVDGISSNELISTNTNISITFAPDQPIIFSRLTGDTTQATVYLNDGIKSSEITINNEGRINW